jgi:hypothetical protein
VHIDSFAVNGRSTPDATFSRFVAEHAIAHTYSPFYRGINEPRYGFMDEGWATTFARLIGQSGLGAGSAAGDGHHPGGESDPVDGAGRRDLDGRGHHEQRLDREVRWWRLAGGRRSRRPSVPPFV